MGHAVMREDAARVKAHRHGAPALTISGAEPPLDTRRDTSHLSSHTTRAATPHPGDRPTMPRQATPFDIVLYGATGFTGRQAATYLAAHAPGPLRLAIAGRSEDKLRAVQQALPAEQRQRVSIVVADSTRPDSVDALAASARVVVTTAGPYARYGDPVVDACVRHATDYVDITGETPWVRRVIDRHHETAAASGTRIVPFCGFDSVPSDLGTWLVVDHARRELGELLREVHIAFQLRGGLNGGTLASMLALAEQDELDLIHDPLLLNPAHHRSEALRQAQTDPTRPWFEPALGRWTAPFFMAPVNSRVVRRSAALSADYGEPWGEPLLYRESLLVGRRAARLQARAMASALRTFERAVRLRPVRRLVERLGPDPGHGPSEETLERGFFRANVIATTERGALLRAEISDHGDPGNRATVKMLCESALALATQRDALPGGAERGGVLTPATALGGVLVDRLRAAGMVLAVRDGAEPG